MATHDARHSRESGNPLHPPPISAPEPAPVVEGFPPLPCESLSLNQGGPQGGWSADEEGDYTAMGQLQHLAATVASGDSREYNVAYDALGRVTSAATTSHEKGDFTRTFGYAPEWATAGELTRTGPEASPIDTAITLDDAGRVEALERDGVTVDYTYDERGLVTDVVYGNGARIEYEYDEDHRVIRIEHFDESDDTMLKLEYTYDNRDLPTEIAESDEGGAYASTAFVYDNRGRLIAETRVVTSGPSPEYDLEYVYDQAGNRLYKVDNLGETQTHYYYDIDDPEAYLSDNNRLEYYQLWDTSGESISLASTTWYVYGDDNIGQPDREGNPVRIITEMADSPGEYSAVHFVYDRGQRVWLMVGETWEEDGPDEANCPDGYTIEWAREFRYDGGRARYLNRDLDPEELAEGNLVSLSDTWTDYDGATSYGDFEFAGEPLGPADLRSYEPGVALKDPIDESTGIEYYHADHLGTTRAMTDYAGASASSTVYTAFGERVDAGGYQRYGYVGAYGYQAHDFPEGAVIRFLHVGARYYDPSTGRFLQRDPIGIVGGLNVYIYVGNAPISTIDPLGLVDKDDIIIWITGGYSGDPWCDPLARFFDDKAAVDLASEIAAFIAGGAIGLTPAGPFLAGCATIYGAATYFGAPTGNRQFQGFAAGVGVGGLVRGVGPALARRIGPAVCPPNPGPYVSPFPPMPKGPFIGGGRPWP